MYILVISYTKCIFEISTKIYTFEKEIEYVYSPRTVKVNELLFYP